MSAASERAERLRAKKRKLDQASAPLVDLTNLPSDHEDSCENGLWKEIGGVKLFDADRQLIR